MESHKKYEDGGEYEGEFKNGKENGFGIKKGKDGQIYEGEFLDGMKEGKGKLTYPNGFVYDGDFIGGRPRGNANIISDGKTIPVQYSDGRFYQV